MQHPWARTIRGLLLLTAVYAVSGIAQETPSGMQRAGLALHQETGRSIYLGGIYVDASLSRPFDYIGNPGPKIMEYRVEARRTSMRSLLGSMLLQSEVATGEAPGAATNAFANTILSAVRGSLYAGDRLEIKLGPDGDTLAKLNAHPLARSPGTQVLNYLIMGWIGERGPATAFRNSILADRINPELLTMLQQSTYTSERRAQVVAWTAPQEAQPIAGQSADPATDTAEPAPAGIKGPPVPVTGASIASATSLEEVQPRARAIFSLPPSVAEPTAGVADPGLSVSSAATVQVASLTPAQGLLEDARLDVANMDIKLYSQRLSVFHAGVVSRVYGEIRYPRRAVKRGLEGRLELDLALQEDGSLLGVSVVQSSGHNILDEAAVKAAEQAFRINAPGSIDPVAVAEFSTTDSGNLVIPVPVTFMLTQ